MKAIALSIPAMFKLSQFAITKEWFKSFKLPTNAAGLKRVVINDIVYLLEETLDDDDGHLIVIDLREPAAVFDNGENDVAVLDRLITVARSIYTNSVSVPSSWYPHREGHLLSISSSFSDRRSRVHFDQFPNGQKDILVFSRTESAIAFPKLTIPLQLHMDARADFAAAVLSAPAEPAKATNAGIVLSQRLPQGFVQGATLDQWYKSKLTEQQREFVNKPHDGPVRLRGSAGTGKTLSLVIKFLIDGASAEKSSKNPKPVRFGFLTHSLASVDLVNAIAESLDSLGLMFGKGTLCKLEVRTLYDLAAEHLHFALDKLAPLSLDGREGRRLQLELIENCLKEMASSPIVPLEYSKLTPDLKSRWVSSAAGNDPQFFSEVMNEFASVLDAEGIRAGEEKADNYVTSRSHRPEWLIALPTEIDRRFMLEVHRRYRRMLTEMNTMSVDQMISDFNSFLNQNRWDVIRNRVGYDALFVDELHLFTSMERLALHKLIKNQVADDGKPVRPPIFMAYDLKQSPRDTFTQYSDSHSSLFSASTGLQNSALVKLEQVFRYTPQIADFLTDLDASFPAINIPGEWDSYVGKDALGNGSKPSLTVYPDERTLFRSVLEAAHRSARLASGGGRRVAVLCASEELFDRYLTAALGQYKGRIVPIDSREPSSELRHAGKRFIFSMPEYVAGLQFETVYLMDVNAKEAPSDASFGMRRRFISNLYLGSSRAEKRLYLSANALRGGPSDVLTMALERGSLVQVAPQ